MLKNVQILVEYGKVRTLNVQVLLVRVKQTNHQNHQSNVTTQINMVYVVLDAIRLAVQIIVLVKSVSMPEVYSTGQEVVRTLSATHRVG